MDFSKCGRRLKFCGTMHSWKLCLRKSTNNSLLNKLREIPNILAPEIIFRETKTLYKTPLRSHIIDFCRQVNKNVFSEISVGFKSKVLPELLI